MGQVVMRFRKAKKSSCMTNFAAHNSREKIFDHTGGLRPRPENLPETEVWPPEWIRNIDRFRLNEGHTGKREDGITKAWHRTVKEADLKRKPQENAAMAIEAVFSASAGTFKTAGKWREYLEDCRLWAEKKFGHENVLQWNTHYDEKTPHLHMILIPIIRDPHTKNKYSSSEFLGGPEGLRQLQTDIADQVGKKYGLERGQEGSKKKHTNLDEWKSELTKKDKELGMKDEELDMKEKELVKKLADMEAYHKEQKELADKKIKELDEKYAKLDAIKNEVQRDLKHKEEAIDLSIKNLQPKEKASVIVINTLKDNNVEQPEVAKFWPAYYKRLPELVKDTLQDVRREMKEERKMNNTQTQQNDRGGSRR